VFAAEIPVPMPVSPMAPPVAALPPPRVASAAAVVLRGSRGGEAYFRHGS
jgi:hypothetical protein